jgi:hypothetical protein
MWTNKMMLFMCVATVSCSPDTLLKSSHTTVVDALLAAAEVASFSARKNSAHQQNVSSGRGWLPGMWFEAGMCIRKDYKKMKEECTQERVADYRDQCSVPTPHDKKHHQPKLYEHLVSLTDLEQSARVLELLKPALSSLISLTFNASGLPAVVHQTWKSEDVGEEIDYKVQMDAWEDDSWIHLVWTDEQLNRLITAVVPWMGETLQRLPRPVDKIDVMRYLLLYIFGGVYLDADMLRINGNLNEVFRGLPPNSIAAGIDPSAIASFPRHPLLLQMIVWIVSRAKFGLIGGRHELTGPEGWRRTVNAYRQCVIDSETGHQHLFPSALFNQHPCSCWGVEVVPNGENPTDTTSVRFVPIPGSDGLRAAGLIMAKDVLLRADTPCLTRDISIGGHGLSKSRIKDTHTGPILESSLVCVAYHRCSRIYGRGIEDWDGGWTLGNGVKP